MTVQEVTREQAVRRATIASVVGTTIEWYDFFLYGTAAALVFPQLFFPGQNTFAGVLAAFGTQFVGFVARPVGAAIFGHFGDRIGRKTTLMATLFLMAFGTVLIGFLPTYQSIGIAAPIILVLLRIIQGIGVGGEWGGSVLLSMEWGQQKRRGLSASWPQMGVPLGLVLSTGVVRITSGMTGTEGFAAYGWRIPFILSILLIGVGLFVRMRVVESPEFEAIRKSNKVIKNPLIEVLRRQPKQVLLTALVRTSEQAPFYLFITFVLTYAVKHLKLNSNSILDDTLIAAALGLISIPVFGRLSDRFGRRRVYGTGIVLTAVFAFPYFGLLNTGNALLVGTRHHPQPDHSRRPVWPAGGTDCRKLRRRHPLHRRRHGLPAGQRDCGRPGPADRGRAAGGHRRLHGDLGVHHYLLRHQHARVDLPAETGQVARQPGVRRRGGPGMNSSGTEAQHRCDNGTAPAWGAPGRDAPVARAVGTPGTADPARRWAIWWCWT